jgi:DNA invertase Pin-like site-specific DNA recombinase
VIIGAIAELERNLIIERARAGMRRVRLEGRHSGRKPLELDRESIVRDRDCGMSLGELARTYHASRTTIRRMLKPVPKGSAQSIPQPNKSGGPFRPPEL